MIVIYNPTAGRRRTALLWPIMDILIANGLRPQIVETQASGHATVLAHKAVAAGERLVVAAGGDGTIAEVASGLIGTDTSLGIIPLGTANVLARELTLPYDPYALAATLAFGRTRSLWPGIADSSHGSRLFVQMLGVGPDAQVAHRVNSRVTRVIVSGVAATSSGS